MTDAPPRPSERRAVPDLVDLSLAAEAQVLATAVLYYDDVVALVDQIDPEQFVGPGHRAVATAVLALHRAGRSVDPVILGDELASDGGHHLRSLRDLIVVEVHARGRFLEHLETVRNHHARRAVVELGYDIEQAIAQGRIADASELMEAAALRYRTIRGGVIPPRRFRLGGAALFDDDDLYDEPLWGRDDESLWPSGEPLLIVAPPGVGKTTIAQQVTLGRIGLRDEVLGYPVQPTTSRLLYLAMDRPKQIKRSMLRMVTTADHLVLDERLRWWEGTLPESLLDHPDLLVRMAQEAGADTVIVDSLKDVAPKLSDDEVGGRLNIALQTTVAAGIDLLITHHQRKGQTGGPKPNGLDDVYGSRWITAGAGSVLMLWGEPGASLVELTHLKQPAEPVGPLTLEHDHAQGSTSVFRGFDLHRYLELHPRGATVREIAVAMLDKPDPTEADRKKAERKLKAAETKGWVHRRRGQTGGEGGSKADRWHLVDTRREEP